MDERPEPEADDPTPEEQAIEDDTPGEEARRIGEFDDLRHCLERIENTLRDIASALDAMRTTAAAIDIDNGADVVDADGDADAATDDDDEACIIPDYDDMDLDL